MLRYCFVLVSVTGLTLAGYPDGYSGNAIGNSNGYGYSGSFSGSGQPNFPGNFGGPPFDFPGFLNNYLGSLNRYHQEFMRKGGGLASYSYASSSPTANAKASSSLVFNRNYGIQAASQGYGQAGGFGGSFGSGTGGGYAGGNGGAYGGSFSGPGNAGYAPASAGFAPNNGGGAVSTAFIGPGGGHQTASVYPENPNYPNVNTRFGGSDQPGGFHSVFTSSQSETANVGGRPVTVERAQTTINDNGKITTYTAKNP